MSDHKLDDLLDAVDKTGYIVECYTNDSGDKFTFVLWKDGKQITDIEPGTWKDLEPMYKWILETKIPALEEK